MPKNAIVAVTLLIMGWAGPLFAEPISFVYNVHIASTTVFPLTLTFDSEGSESEFDNRRQRTYGKPLFSTIPLERFGAPPIAPESFDLSQTTQTIDKNPDGTWTNTAVAHELRAFFVNDDPDTVFTEVWQTLLLAQQTTVSEPTLSAESVGRLLGQSRDTPDYSSSFLHSYASASQSFLYSGFALLADQTAPIPEPGTCILVGSALMGVWYRRRRKLS